MTVILNQAAAPPVFQAVAEDVSFTEVKQKKKEEAASVAARLKGTQSAAGTCGYVSSTAVPRAALPGRPWNGSRTKWE